MAYEIGTITNKCTNPRGRHTFGTVVIDPENARADLLAAIEAYAPGAPVEWVNGGTPDNPGTGVIGVDLVTGVAQEWVNGDPPATGGWTPIVDPDVVNAGSTYEAALIEARPVGWEGEGLYWSSTQDSIFVPGGISAQGPGESVDGTLVVRTPDSTTRTPINGPIVVPATPQSRYIRVAAIDGTYLGPYFDGDSPPFTYNA